METTPTDAVRGLLFCATPGWRLARIHRYSTVHFLDFAFILPDYLVLCRRWS